MSLRYDRFWQERYGLDHKEIFTLRKDQKKNEEETLQVETRVRHCPLPPLTQPRPLTPPSMASSDPGFISIILTLLLFHYFLPYLLFGMPSVPP